MHQQVQELTAYFDATIAACQQKQQALMADQRGDEATFEQIRSNVYGIFRTVLGVVQRMHPDNLDAMQLEFEKRLEAIPANWFAAQEKAQEHGNAAAFQVEQIKIDTLNDIKAASKRIWRKDA